MHALIGPDLLRKLTPRNLNGYVLRCRASGTHSYLVSLGRGRWTTIGRVGDISSETARLAAESLLSGVARDTLKILSDEPTMNLRDARARARGEMRGPRGQRRATWKQFIDDHYAPWVTQHRKIGAETVSRLRSRFGTFDDVRLSNMSQFAIERWRSTRLKSGIKPATVNRDFASLRAALTKAVEWRAIKAHPMSAVKMSKIDTTGHVRYLSEDEETRLLAALTARDEQRRAERERANDWRRARGYDELPAFDLYTDDLYPIVHVALHTGCRRGELFDLQWRDIDLVTARLTVRAETAKSGRSRVVPLNVEAVKTLRAWRPAGVEPTHYVFPADDGGRLQDIKTAFLKAVRDAGFTAFRFHDLRAFVCIEPRRSGSRSQHRSGAPGTRGSEDDDPLRTSGPGTQSRSRGKTRARRNGLTKTRTASGADELHRHARLLLANRPRPDTNLDVHAQGVQEPLEALLTEACELTAHQV